MKTLIMVLLLGVGGAVHGASAKATGYAKAAEYFREDKRLYPRAARPKAKVKTAKMKRAPAKAKTIARVEKRKTRRPASLAQAPKKPAPKNRKKPSKLIVSF